MTNGRHRTKVAAVCSEEGCRKSVWAMAPRRGKCSAHYQHHRRNTPGFVQERERLPEWLLDATGHQVSAGRFLRALVELSLAWRCSPQEAFSRLEASR